MIFRFFVVCFFLVCGFVYIFFSKDNIDYGPINLTDQSCCVDEMILMEWSGPKAQIVWKDNKRTFYCDVKEIFYEIFNDILRNRIRHIYVQDFSGLDWDAYFDKWILAEDAVYVIDSNKKGAMNLSYVPFSNTDKAVLFMEKNGGILLKFYDINRDVFDSSYKKNMSRVS
ncbi:MAG TPA: nitrous oxide reductase accessory protein NosL [Candidatus Azoamicus sp. OHIO1]